MNRLKNLFSKIASVKGLFALVATGAWIFQRDEWTSWVMVYAWTLLILGREVFKLVTVWRGK